jgi:hypothetical protein
MLAGLPPATAALRAASEESALAPRVLALLAERHRRGGSKCGPLALELGEDVRFVREVLERASVAGLAHAAKSTAGATIWRPGPGPARASVRAASTPGAPAPPSAEKLPPVGSGADGDQAEEGEDELPDEDGSDEGASDAGDGEDSEAEDEDGELPAYDEDEDDSDDGDDGEDEDTDMTAHTTATPAKSRMNGAPPATTKQVKPAPPPKAAPTPRPRQDLAGVRARAVGVLRERGEPMRAQELGAALGEDPRTVSVALREARAAGSVTTHVAGAASTWCATPPARARPSPSRAKVAPVPSASSKASSARGKPPPTRPKEKAPKLKPAEVRPEAPPRAAMAAPDAPTVVVELLRADPDRLRDVLRVLSLIWSGRP